MRRVTRREGLRAAGLLAGMALVGGAGMEASAAPAKKKKSKKARGQPFKHDRSFVITLERDDDEPDYGDVVDARCLYIAKSNDVETWPLAEAGGLKKIKKSPNGRRVTLVFTARVPGRDEPDEPEPIPPVPPPEDEIECTMEMQAQGHKGDDPPANAGVAAGAKDVGPGDVTTGVITITVIEAGGVEDQPTSGIEVTEVDLDPCG